MKRVRLLLVLLTSSFFGHSQDIVFNYSSNGIADSLKKDANTVMRLDEAFLEVLSPSKYSFKVHQVMTILDPGGAYHLRHRLGFDKFYLVDDVTIKVYTGTGFLTKKYSKKDFSVEAAYDGISLATDDKVMELTTSAPGYPCTVEVEYTIKANSYIELPDWHLNTNNTSTEVFRYSVTTPSDLDIRHRTVNIDLSPAIQVVNNKKIYSWEIKNVKAKKVEAGGFRASSYMPRIEVAPSAFEYDGREGKFSNWKDFGEWCYNLYQERNPFSESRRNEIRTLIANYGETKDKVTILYDYLKKNMRYVSIQFGIGGFKPFPVKYVDEKKYGDCKALTNYMRYLLDVAGIKSYPALINAGNESPPVDPAFPSSIFNHVILCIPQQPDTIWLECTSNNSEMGFLGSFTENKNALLLTENGGLLTKTPSSNAKKNLLWSRSELFIDEQGGAKIHTQIFSKGDIAQELLQIKQMDPDDQKEAFVNELYYKPADDFVITHKDTTQGHSLQITTQFEKFYAFKAGNKLFFPQKSNKLYQGKLKDEIREQDFLFDYPYQKADTTIVHFPNNLLQDELPASIEISKQFGYYKKQISSNTPTTIMIITSLYLKQHIITANQYKEVKDFFDKVNESEEQNIVLKKL